MPHRLSSARPGLLHRLRLSRPWLRLVFLLIGSALALSLASIDLAVASALWDEQPALLGRLLVAVVAVAPPTLLGLLPQLRTVEGVAAASLLGVDFGGHSPGLTRTWDQRWRTAAWFWAHLTAGAATGVVLVVGAITCAQLVAAPFVRSPGAHVLGSDWITVDGSWRDALLVLLALLVALIGAGLLVVVGEVLVLLAPMLLGPSVPELLAELESRTAHLVERTRIARELHDSVGHALSVVVLQTAAARRKVGALDPDANGQLEVVERVARRALEDLDGVLGLLREDHAAQGRQPVHDLRSLAGLVRATGEAGHEIALELELPDVGAVPGVVSREAYRIVQEGLTNAIRHAPDQPVMVRLERLRGALRIHVANPLASSSEPAFADGGGRGLAGVRERVRLFGGKARIGSRDGTWQLDVTLPLPTHDEKVTR